MKTSLLASLYTEMMNREKLSIRTPECWLYAIVKMKEDSVNWSLFGMIHKNRTLLLDDIKDQLHASKDRFTLNCMIVTANGSCRPVELAGHVEDEKTGSHLIHVFVINEKGRLPSYEVDPVTGLPGMRRFIAAAHEVVRENAQKSHPDRLYLLFFNISHFKMFNVNYGITAGDKFLKMMGESIRQVFSDSFISRFDVDHFMVLAEGGDIDRCLKEVHYMILRIRPSAKVECKIGVYELHGETLNPDLALASVKIACDSIRNTPDTFYAYYTDSMGKSLTVREYVTKNIDEAIEKEYIKAYFQPVVRTISKTLCGMEALARWNDPVKGFLCHATLSPLWKTAVKFTSLIWRLFVRCAGILHFAREAERLLFLFRSIFRASIFFAAIFLRK